MIDHGQAACPPEPVLVLLVITEGQGLEMGILAVKELYFPGSEILLVVPDELASVTGSLLRRDKFRHRAGQASAGLIADIAIAKLGYLLGAKILVGKFTTNERT